MIVLLQNNLGKSQYRYVYPLSQLQAKLLTSITLSQPFLFQRIVLLQTSLGYSPYRYVSQLQAYHSVYRGFHWSLKELNFQVIFRHCSRHLERPQTFQDRHYQLKSVFHLLLVLRWYYHQYSGLLHERCLAREWKPPLVLRGVTTRQTEISFSL